MAWSIWYNFTSLLISFALHRPFVVILLFLCVIWTKFRVGHGLAQVLYTLPLTKDSYFHLLLIILITFV